MPEVIDCWFDSGSMPFAQHHYPFENQDAVRAAVPGRLHLRGGGPDPRLVLFAAGHLHSAVQQGTVYRNVSRLGPCAGRERTEDVQVQGQRGGPLRGAGHLRRRRHPLVFLQQFRALAAQPFSWQSGERGTAQIYGYAVEHLCFLCSVCEYR